MKPHSHFLLFNFSSHLFEALEGEFVFFPNNWDTRRIHGTGIFTYIYHESTKCRQIPYMDSMGYDSSLGEFCHPKLHLGPPGAGVDLRGVRWSSSPSPWILCIKMESLSGGFKDVLCWTQHGEQILVWRICFKLSWNHLTSSPWLCLKSKKHVPLENSRWFKVTFWFPINQVKGHLTVNHPKKVTSRIARNEILLPLLPLSLGEW